MVTSTKSGLSNEEAGALEGRLIERPVWRPQPPDQPAELAPVGGKAGAPALGVEIVLVPEAMLLLGRCRHAGARDVLDVVAVAGNEAAHALRPQRRVAEERKRVAPKPRR